MNAAATSQRNSIRAIAFYLPQYHPIPENDAWWGRGFTAWRGVAAANPSFVGHDQPHIPGDLGFYDLRVAESRVAQAALAKAYGVHGFCYYYYWFDGKRLLDRPLNEVRASGEPDYPFCICWANESWTRRGDGKDDDVLIAQNYLPGWEQRFIDDVLPVLADPRYIRVNGKPLLLVYRAEALPDPTRTAEIWRERARRHGIGEIYLAAVESFSSCNPRLAGFDAAIEFPPAGQRVHAIGKDQLQLIDPNFNGLVQDYIGRAQECLARPTPAHVWFRGIIPRWDNTPRLGSNATIYVNSAPQNYARWLDGIAQWTMRHRSGDERLIFINAWNEWGDGCHLEPDFAFGHAYLQVTRDVLARHQAAAVSA